MFIDVHARELSLIHIFMRRNMTTFRMFSPDENASNKLDGVYKASRKTWLAETLPEDSDGTEIAPDGRVMEMLSEHTIEGWLEGYLLTGRHGLLNSYEAFIHIIDSMYNPVSYTHLDVYKRQE